VLLLERLVECGEGMLSGSTEVSLKIKAHYMARVFDVIDVLNAAAGAA
jgi:hypothetical protein